MKYIREEGFGMGICACAGGRSFSLTGRGGGQAHDTYTRSACPVIGSAAAVLELRRKVIYLLRDLRSRGVALIEVRGFVT